MDATDNKNKVQTFANRRVRAEWDAKNEKWWFSVVDVISVLADSYDHLTARKYWNKLKQRLKEEGNETVTICHQLKMVAPDGAVKMVLLLNIATNNALIFILREQAPSCHFLQGFPFLRWHQ